MDMKSDTAQSDAKDKEYYARIAADYFRRHEQPIQRYSSRVESRWLKECIPPGSSVLLVGAGGGREIPPLLDLACRITAIDYSEEMVDTGKVHWKDHPIEWHVADVHDLKEFHDQFDFALCLAAVNYFVDPNLAFREMGKTLTSGGQLIVSSINAAHPTEAGYKPKPGYTRTLFDPDALSELARQAGLVVKDIRGLRILVDSLPVGWNRPGATPLQRTGLNAVLAVEPLLRLVAKPRRGKFFWLTAERP